MIYFHSYQNSGLVIDIAADITSINNQAVFAKKTGVIILGGGLVKHHICNANLMVGQHFVIQCFQSHQRSTVL
jgi:deoxyhypusine synthase